MSMITVVGVGPGDPEYLTMRVQRIVGAADVVAGFSTVLDVVHPWLKGRVLTLDFRNQERELGTLAEEANKGRRCVVCAWGDPNFSARELIERVRQVCPDVVVVDPGISSVQIACARAGLDMEHSIFVTLHTRAPVDEALAELVEIVQSAQRTAFVLPRPWDLMPPTVAAQLIERGVSPALQVAVYERLTLKGEREHRMRLAELAESEHTFSDLSILVIPVPAWAANWRT